MNRRDLMKLLPLGAVAPAVVKVGTVEAQAFAVRPEKKYVFVVPSDVVTVQFAEGLKREMVRLGIDGTLVCGNLEIYELE